MQKVQIINPTLKTFIVNSLKLKIPPTTEDSKPLIRDASVAEDPDIQELVSAKQLYVVNIAPSTSEYKPEVKEATPTEVIPAVKDAEPRRRLSKRERRRLKHGAPEVRKTDLTNQKDLDQKSGGEPGPTSYEDPTAISDEMGRGVIVMGPDGPMKRKMNYGQHMTSGPKFVGDDNDDGNPNDVEVPPGAFIKVT